MHRKGSNPNSNLNFYLNILLTLSQGNQVSLIPIIEQNRVLRVYRLSVKVKWVFENDF